MKHSIITFIALSLSLQACKKQDNAPNQPKPLTTTCSPVIDLEGKWASDSARYVFVKNGTVKHDTTVAYNKPTAYFNLNFYCINTTPIIDGQTNSVTIDPYKYRIFSSTIYIGDDGVDTAKMDKLHIGSLVANHLILKSHSFNAVDSTDFITYISLRK